MSRFVKALFVLGLLCLAVIPATAGAWTRAAQLGALPINGDSKHRLRGFVNWEMPAGWTSSIMEADIPGVRFWPSAPAPGCNALSVFAFQGTFTRLTPSARARQAVPVRQGGALLGAGSRAGGVWRVAQNVIFGDGMPAIPGAHYVDGVGIVKVGSHRYLELAFRSYSSGACIASDVTSSDIVSGAIAFVRSADARVGVIGKWPAGVSR